jgi:hypothetical protein
MSEPDVSMARPQEFKHVLTRVKATLNGAEELLAEFAEQLGSMTGSDDEELRDGRARPADCMKGSGIRA